MATKKTLLTQTEFAAKIGRSRQYVGELKQKGRLVMEGNKVNLTRSLNRIAATADPANDPAGILPRSDGRTAVSVGMQAKGITGKSVANSESTAQYQNSRAVKENYTARLKKLDYEKAAGELLQREGVTMASFKIGRLLRDKFLAFPSRYAPLLAVKSDQRDCYITLETALDSILKEIDLELAHVRNPLQHGF